MASSNTISSTTQKYLDVHDITNDLLIMRDGAVSLILTVNAINFGLLAEEEQDAVIYSYAGLLNSLNYPIEIVIRSQTKDVTNYLNKLKEQEDSAATDIRRNQISRYRAFVGNLVKERNVLDKKFYVVIPASALEMGLLPPSTVVPGIKSVDVSTIERSEILEKARNILEPKRDHLINQFARIGLFARQLTTQEIIQMFYLSYNPEAAEGQQITDTNNYTSTLVSAQVRPDWKQTPVASMNDASSSEAMNAYAAASEVEAPQEIASNDPNYVQAETGVPVEQNQFPMPEMETAPQLSIEPQPDSNELQSQDIYNTGMTASVATPDLSQVADAGATLQPLPNPQFEAPLQNLSIPSSEVSLDPSQTSFNPNEAVLTPESPIDMQTTEVPAPAGTGLPPIPSIV